MDLKGIVVHHSLSGDVSANEIGNWHRARNFHAIGYHFVVRFNGDIEPGRPWDQVGAHAATPPPSRNMHYLGICLTGDFTKHPPTIEQMKSLVTLSRGFISRWDAGKVERHHENCPGPLFPWEFFIAQLKGVE